MSMAHGEIRFIGNATVSVRWGPLHLLTDPNFIHRHEEVQVAPGVTTKRLEDPAVELADLPAIDAIVLSHFHGDHFDQVAERELPKAVPILTPPAAAEELEKRDFTGAIGLEAWESHELRAGDHRITVTAVPGRHGPPVVDFALPDVMGSIWDLDGPEGRHRLYVSGDTLVFDDLHEIPRRFDEIDLGIFHLGGTRLAGVMLTLDGEQGVEAVRIIDPEQAIPVHYDDYDVFTSPLSDFLERMREVGLEDRVTTLPRGGTFPLRPRSGVGARR